MLLLLSAFFKINIFFQKLFQDYDRSVKRLDPDHPVGPDLGQNCLKIYFYYQQTTKVPANKGRVNAPNFRKAE